ncbi:MAG: hypothetical protein ACI9XU_000230 [Arenicella sp.]|jgi:hypothetical protein
MTIYDTNLHIAVDEILGTTAARKQKTNSAKISAQYSLYFAQGGLITANEKLAKVGKKYDTAHDIDDQGVENINLATNLSKTTAAIGTNVAATVINTATAAADVQVAAVAVSKLAADIGAAFNLASASDPKDDIYRMAKKVNKLIKETSFKAELASKLAMSASTASAEMISPVLVAEAAAVQSEIENVLKTTRAEFEKLQTQRSIDNQRVAAASIQERAAEGVLRDTMSEYRAVAEALTNSNRQLNNNLLLMMKSTSEDISFDITFDAYKYPFSETLLDLKTVPEDSKDSVNNAHAIKYRVVFVNAGEAAQFTQDKAEVNFSENKSYFHKVSPSEQNDLEFSALCDSGGKALKLGNPYVAFLFIQLPQAYKQKLRDFSDVLSAPTQEFTPSYQLPVPLGITKKETDSKGNVTQLGFAIPESFKIPELLEYRCILIQKIDPSSNQMMTANSLSLDDGAQNVERCSSNDIGIYFDLSIAQQVSAGNYAQALRMGSSCNYVVPINSDTTDNFGSELVKGKEYFVIILAVNDASKDYQNNMSDPAANVMSLVGK